MQKLPSRKCLNGWWDYAPADTPEAESVVPQYGWQEKRYLVPSLADKSLAGVRRKGETYYGEHLKADPATFCNGEHEFLFDNHNYPVEWMAARSGWARRKLQVEALAPGRRRFLRLDAVAGRSEVWINGARVAVHDDAFLPQEIDITNLLREGQNELAVLIRDYERLPADPKKTLTPSGNMMSAHIRGIWQDVWLIERGEVFVSDVTIRTSVRQKNLTVIAGVTNAGGQAAEVDLVMDVAPRVRGGDAFEGPSELALPAQKLAVPARETVSVEVTIPWTDAKLWQPESPHLYWLRCQVMFEGRKHDRIAERFGFREVWIDGPDFLLNGFPVHFFSDWGHKVNQLHHTEAWNRCWFAMMKAENFNHSRLHTHPHPQLILDLADEEGVMITGETGIHGSGGEQAADEDRYWQAAEAHIRAFVRRDKNHPSLLLWSVENEMRWNQDNTDLTKRRLPELYSLFRQLDPTREAYHEGDSSLWNENEQAIMSRHYGKECGGYGWWDKKRPLHAGEMSAYHYMGPNTNFHTGGGDGLWADYRKVVEAAARETAWIIEAGRTQGTSAFGPWNISCLCNLRTEPEPVTLDYSDWTTPGVKPQFIQPHSSEFAFWKNDGPAYAPFGDTNAIQARAFRPFALIDLSHRRSCFGGKRTKRTLHMVNDTPGEVSGSLHVALKVGGEMVFEQSEAIAVPRGRVVARTFEITLPDVARATAAIFSAKFIEADGRPADELRQDWTLHPVVPECRAARTSRILLIGEGPSSTWLEAMGFRVERLAAFDGPLPAGFDLVILERNVVTPGSRQNSWVEEYLRSGGRVLVLEQKHSLFPGVVLESKPQTHGFPRAYGDPVLSGFTQDDLQFWGEDPYASMNSDAHIAHRLYCKGAECLLQPLVDAGEGGFGLKLPEWIALGELRVGAGRLLACQFRFADKGAAIPEAGCLFAAMIDHLLAGVTTPPPPFIEAEAADGTALQNALVGARDGGVSWIRLRNPEGASVLADKLGISLTVSEEARYHAVRESDDPVLSGVSHVDVSGLDGMTYCFGAESLPVARCAIEPTADIEPLLVTPTMAYLEEQHVHGQRVEALRAHGASRFLFAEQPNKSILLGRLRHGKGWIYFDTFLKTEDSHPRLMRFESMFRRNFGVELPVNALTGDAVPDAIPSSPGFSTQICLQPVGSPERRAALIASTALPAERMAPSTMFRLGGWTVPLNDSGEWTLDKPGEAALFACLHSPRARKIVMEDSGIPNPESLTFLDITAPRGTIELVINGVSLGSKLLESGRATFSDIELAQAFNQILLLWSGSEPGDRLHFHFRDIMQNPETELLFLRCNKEATEWTQQEF